MFGTSSSALSDLQSLWLLDLFPPSTILSVNFHSFLCASCVVGTCIKISGIPVKESKMTFPQLSAPYALEGTWRLEMYRNWHINDLVIVLYSCTFDGFQAR